MPVPFAFGSATSAIPLSQLDANFNTTITLGNTAIQLGNTVTTLNNMTLANVTISSGNVTITNVTVTTANVTTVNATTVIATTANVTTGNVTNLISGNVALTGGAINGTTLGATTAASANVTTLTTSSTVTLNGGTAGGVAYLNGSKVLTTGSALTFDGTTLTNLAASGLAAVFERTNAPAVIGIKYNGAVGGYLGAAAAGALTWYNDAGSELMRLTSTGLGIGTSSPASKLDVTTTGADSVLSITVAGVQRWQHRVMLATGYWQLHDPTGGNTALTVDTSGNLGIGTTSPGGRLEVVGASQILQRYTGSATGFSIGQYNASGDASINNGANANLLFATNNTERARIDSSGNLVGAGTTSIIYWEGVYNNTTASAANMFVASNGSFGRSTSALKYKQDIRDLESVDVDLLRPVRYKSKCENDDQTKDHFGLIADEAADAGFEELVTRGSSGEVEGFQYERLTVVLLKEIQSLRQRVAQLEGA